MQSVPADPYASVMEAIAKVPGGWTLTGPSRRIRHAALRGSDAAPACPLLAATGRADGNNSCLALFSTSLGLRLEEVHALMAAADNFTPALAALRKRMLEACKLEEPS